jgi:Trk K+ transport system NAD-binding subunit
MTFPPEPAAASIANDGLPHIIVSGLDNLGRRTIEELRLGDEPVVAIAADEDEGEGLVRPDVHVVIGDHKRERVLREAGVSEASSLVLTRDDDLGNLHAALLARELNPSIRLVIRVFDAQIAERLPDLIDNAVALSSSALAAPGFVAAALEGEGGEQFTLAGRQFVVRLATDHDAPDVAPHDHLDRRTVAVIHDDRTVELLPAPGATTAGTPVLLEAHDPTTLARLEQHDERSAVQRLRDRLASPDRRLVRLGGILAVLAVVSAVLFELTVGLTPVRAASWAIGLLTGSGTGFSGVDEAATPDILKGYGILLSLIGAALVGVIYALITDAIIGARLLATLGRRPVPASIRDHVIVCGLGSIGYRVALGIRERGVKVVVVEPDENGRFVAAARALGIPVVVGDARQAEVLTRVGLERCRAICTVTSDDLINLTAAPQCPRNPPRPPGRVATVRPGARPAGATRALDPVHAIGLPPGRARIRRGRDRLAGRGVDPGRRQAGAAVRAHPRRPGVSPCQAADLDARGAGRRHGPRRAGGRLARRLGR